MSYQGSFVIMHSKKCWVVSNQIWVKYGLTPNVGLKKIYS